MRDSSFTPIQVRYYYRSRRL